MVRTLYGHPLTLALTGELGAGKTTLLQGFAAALGVQGPLTSPTYALEQRYDTPHGPFLHLDLYRLSPQQAHELLRSSEDFAPEGGPFGAGIRAIEWSERVSLDSLIRQGHVIHADVQERSPGERQIRITFHDARIPDATEIGAWHREVLLPPHIADHCEAVADFAETCAAQLIAQGTIVRLHALRAAARTHDLLRFLDFKAGAGPGITHTPREHARWEKLRTEYGDLHHEEACARFLSKRGFPAIASIVTPHGFRGDPEERRTIEQKLLFYADKRVLLDQVVTLEERFEDFTKRYGNGTMSDEAKQWYGQTKQVESELFPMGLFK